MVFEVKPFERVCQGRIDPAQPVRLNCLAVVIGKVVLNGQALDVVDFHGVPKARKTSILACWPPARTAGFSPEQVPDPDRLDTPQNS